MDIAGQPMLQHVIERTRHAGTIDGILVATTTDPSDDVLEGFAVSWTSLATAAASRMCSTVSIRQLGITMPMWSSA